MTPPAAPTLHCGHECVCAILLPQKTTIDLLPCTSEPDCIFDTRTHSSTHDADARQRIEDVIDFIKRHDDEICGSYGLWEMNSDECMSFDGSCTLCKVTKAIALLKDGVERK